MGSVTRPDPVEDPVVFAKYPYQMYNQYCNFRYFHTGFLMLFRMSTGESWNGVMHDVMVVYPNSWIFFVSYMMIVSMIMFNLLIAVVLEQFATVMKNDASLVTPDHIAHFAQEWARFDPEASHWIQVHDLVILLKRLPPPLGLRDGVSPVYALADHLYVPSHGGRCHYIETLSALVRHAYDSNEVDEELTMSDYLAR